MGIHLSPSKASKTRLGQLLDLFAIFVPVFAFLTAFGFGILYYITTEGLEKTGPQQLITLTIGTTVFGFFYFFLQGLLRRGYLFAVLVLMQTSYQIFLIFTDSLISGISWAFYLFVWAIPLFVFWQADNNRQRIVPIVAGVIGTLGVFAAEQIVEKSARLPITEPAMLVSFLFFSLTMSIMVGLIVIIRVARFRTLASSLTASFLVIVAIPALIIFVISGYQSFVSGQEQIFQLLNAINDIKEEQIEQVVSSMKQDTRFILQDTAVQQRIEFLLTQQQFNVLGQFNEEILFSYLENALRQSGRYEEILILDVNGTVIISTDDAHTTINFSQQDFFNRGSQDVFTTTLTNVPEFGDKAFIVSEPIKDAEGKTIGVIVLRSEFTVFENIVQQRTKTGTEDETYLISENYRPLSTMIGQMNQSNDNIVTNATLKAIGEKTSDAKVYPNYVKVNVLGSYRWVEGLHAALISEVSQAKALANIYSLIILVGAAGIFTTTVAIMAVVITSRELSDPIRQLSGIAGQFASGDLSVRAGVKRDDEIGQLSEAFDSLATRIQDMVSGLERRISERTRDIQRQALRLRVASEISRDSASATDLNELLNRSTRLIRERFGYYHSGIFLIDENREYAVLSAATGDAGKLMLETGHKLRVGEGLVGSVAQSGESRLAVDTGTEKYHFKNPMLPATKSELALPLKLYNRVIGILDVQSDLANAFGEDDMATLQIMADQLAVAIERTRAFQESENNLRALQRSYQEYTKDSWKALLESRDTTHGYVYEGVTLKPLYTASEDTKATLRTGKRISSNLTLPDRQITSLSVPIQLRGQTIGVVNLKFGSEVDNNTVQIIEETVGRLAQTLETSRLIMQSRQRADQERAIAESANRIGSSNEVNEIMRTTVEELSKLLKDADIAVQIGTK